MSREFVFESVKGVVVIRPEVASLGVERMKRFKGLLIRLAQKGETRFVLDLDQVGSIDSSGLGTIVFARKALAGNGEMALCRVNENISRLLTLTRLSRIFAIYETPDEAVAALARDDAS